MSIDVRRYVSSCTSCQRNKPTNQRTPGLLSSLPIPTQRWQEVSMDFITKLPQTPGGHDAIWVVVDRLTKRAHFFAINGTISASQLAQLYLCKLFPLHGIPKCIVSNRDSKFTSAFWKELFSTLGTQLSLSTAHHPQTDGQSERVNCSLIEMLRHFLSSRHDA
ncbi:uncharacterized protein VTP21DRAFT_9640 [Calcarisporiella thermophila]|uniref:uncharacterized protein n=1 Tax=Calcarisporiella thermophila TaxID=911321 RepID=UPI00374434CE